MKTRSAMLISAASAVSALCEGATFLCFAPAARDGLGEQREGVVQAVQPIDRHIPPWLRIGIFRRRADSLVTGWRGPASQCGQPEESVVRPGRLIA
jgi:hypothetical protein